MPDSRRCEQCGLELPANVDDGLCPRCLLGVGLSIAAGEGHLHIRCPHCLNPIELVSDDAVHEIVCPSCDSKLSLIGEKTLSVDRGRLRRIGRFELLDQIGIGGFGAVWRARDTELQRIVAVKVPRRNQLSADEVEQFVREARSAAQLRHPHIVPVHEVGYQDELVFIVSEYIDGITLADWLNSAKATPDEAAELCGKVSAALAHAHRLGVVHRDLKPSNIMLARKQFADEWSAQHDNSQDHTPHNSQELRSYEPCLMDFGLAKRDAGEVTLTIDGKILGTPAYMSPEQARGEGNLADARSDVYSLGVVLFELLTGERPFRGNSRMLLTQVIHDDPPSPRRLNGRVPRDLETICLKCLEKSPDRRFASAAELQAELQRYLRREPIRSHPVSRWERTRRWCQRNPLVASLSAALLLLLISVAIGSTAAAIRLMWANENVRKSAEVAKQAQHLESEQRAKAVQYAEESRGRLVRHFVAEGNRLTETGDWFGGLPWFVEALRLEQGSPKREEMHRRRIQIIRQWSPQLVTQLAHEGSVRFGIFHPDGRRVLTLSGNQAQLWHADTGRAALPPLTHSAQVLNAEFTPDGLHLMTVTGAPPWNYQGAVHVWEVESGRRVGGPMLHEGRAAIALVTPDARRIATIEDQEIGRDYYRWTARLWDTATSQVMAELGEENTSWGSYHASFSRDGRRLALGLSNNVQVFDSQDGHPVSPPIPIRYNMAFTCFSRDGQQLAVARNVSPRESRSYEAEIQVYNAQTGTPIGAALHPRVQLQRMWFSDDGRRMVVVGEEGGLWIGDVASGSRVGGSHDVVLEVSRPWISADGLLAAVPDDSHYMSLRVWNLARGQPLTPELHHSALITHAHFSPDGKRLLTTSVDQTARVWHLPANSSTVPPLLHRYPSGEIEWTRVSDDGSRVLVCYQPGNLRLFHADRAEAATDLRSIVDLHAEDDWYEVQCSPDVQYVLYRNQEGNVMRLDMMTGATIQLAQSAPDMAPAIHIAPSGDRALLVTGREQLDSAECRIVALADGRRLAEWQDEARYPNVRWSSDGRRLAVFERYQFRLMDVATGQTIAQLSPSDSTPRRFLIEGAAFSPDGNSVVIFTNDVHDEPGRTYLSGGELHVWNAADGRPRYASRRVDGFLAEVEFSADNHHFLSVTNSRQNQFGPPLTKDWGEVQVWDVTTGKPVAGDAQVIRHQHHCTARFTHDGKRIVTSSDDGTARVWRVEDLSASTPPMPAKALQMAISRDDRLLATIDGSYDGSVVRVFDLETGEPLAPPIWHENLYVEIHFDATSSRLLVGADSIVHVWELSMEQGEISDLEQWSLAVALQRLDAMGGRVAVRALDSVPIWQQLMSHGEAPRSMRSHQRWHQSAALAAIEVDGWDVALVHLRKLLEYDRDWRLWLHQGLVWEHLNDVDKAIDCFSEALRLAPEQAGLWYQRGEWHAEMRQWENAAHDFGRASELFGNRGQAAWRYALTTLATGRTDRFRQICQGLHALGDQSAIDTDELLPLCLLADEVLSPEELLQRAEAEANPPSGVVYFHDELNHACALYRCGRYEEALQALSELVERDARSEHLARAHLFRSMTHMRLGQTKLAREWLARAAEHLEDDYWEDQLMLMLLHQEATALVK